MLHEQSDCDVTCNVTSIFSCRWLKITKILRSYGRFGRALSLYEVGDREEAIAEMEDISLSLKGYPGIFSRFFISWLYKSRKS